MGLLLQQRAGVEVTVEDRHEPFVGAPVGDDLEPHHVRDAEDRELVLDGPDPDLLQQPPLGVGELLHL